MHEYNEYSAIKIMEKYVVWKGNAKPVKDRQLG